MIVAQQQRSQRANAIARDFGTSAVRVEQVHRCAGLSALISDQPIGADAGVTIAMGTDTGPPARFQGYFEQMELELMAKAGLTPRQVLTSATRDAARCMKIDANLGTLEAGKWADFVVLNADPLVDIKNTRSIDSVWIAGNRIAK